MIWLARSGAAMVASWFLMSLTYPFGWDQGLFAWVGDAIVQGGLPYRDAWDFKGPLLYYVYALAQWLFGVHLWSIRIVDALFVVGAGVLLFRVGTVLTDRPFARFAAVFFLLWYASHSYWHTAQPDGWAGLLILAAVSPLIAGPPSALALFGIGFALGLTVLLKPLWALFVVLPLVHLMLFTSDKRGRAMSAVAVGWLLPIAIMLGWFASRGGLSDLVDVHLRYAAEYAGLASDDRLKGLAQYFLVSRVTAASLPFAIYGTVVLWSKDRSACVLLLLWIVITTALVTLQGRFYAYHWLPMLPAVALLVTVGLHDLAQRVNTLARLAAGVLLLSCAVPIAAELARFGAWTVGVIDRHAYYDAYGEPGADMRAIDWLEAKAEPGPIFAFGWHCSIPWLSGRETVSRFCYSLPLMLSDEIALQKDYRAEVLAAIDRDRPAYVLVGHQSERILGRRLAIDDFPELAAIVRTRYQPVEQFGSIVIHEIRR